MVHFLVKPECLEGVSIVEITLTMPEADSTPPGYLVT